MGQGGLSERTGAFAPAGSPPPPLIVTTDNRGARAFAVARRIVIFLSDLLRKFSNALMRKANRVERDPVIHRPLWQSRIAYQQTARAARIG